MSPRWIAPIVTWLASDRVGRSHGARSSRRRVESRDRRGLAPRSRVSSRSTTPRSIGAGRRRPACQSPPERRHGRRRRPQLRQETSDAHQPRRRRNRVRARRDLVDVEGLPALRPRRGAGVRRAGVHDREHLRRRRSRCSRPSPSIARHGRRSAIGKIGTFNPAMLVHGEQAIELHSRSRPRARSAPRARSPASTTRARARVVVTSRSRPTRRPASRCSRRACRRSSAAKGGWGGDRGPGRRA